MKKRLRLSRLALFPFGALLWVLTSCAPRPTALESDGGPVELYKLQGTIVRLDHEYQTVTIKHGEISNGAGKIWMEAMTMEFPLKDPRRLDKLHKGDNVQATVAVRQMDALYWLEDLR